MVRDGLLTYDAYADVCWRMPTYVVRHGSVPGFTRFMQSLSLSLYIYIHIYMNINTHDVCPRSESRGFMQWWVLRDVDASSCYVSIRKRTSAYVNIRPRTAAYGSIRQHTSAYVSIRHDTRYMSAYVSICQHTSAYASYVGIRFHPVMKPGPPVYIYITDVCVCVCVCVCVYACIHVCMWVSLSLSLSLCIYIYIYIYRDPPPSLPPKKARGKYAWASSLKSSQGKVRDEEGLLKGETLSQSVCLKKETLFL